MLTSDEIRAIEASEPVTIRLCDPDMRRVKEVSAVPGRVLRHEGPDRGVLASERNGFALPPVPGRRTIVSPPPRAPWWRVERAYRRRGIDPLRAEIGIGERWIRRSMALSALYLAAHLVAAWLRR